MGDMVPAAASTAGNVNTPVPTMLPITRPVAQVSPRVRVSPSPRVLPPSGEIGCSGGRTVAGSALERDMAPSYDLVGSSPRVAGRLASAGGGRAIEFCAHDPVREVPLPPAIA
jgi:hypothetical protein